MEVVHILVSMSAAPVALLKLIELTSISPIMFDFTLNRYNGVRRDWHGSEVITEGFNARSGQKYLSDIPNVTLSILFVINAMSERAITRIEWSLSNLPLSMYTEILETTATTARYDSEGPEKKLSEFECSILLRHNEVFKTVSGHGGCRGVNGMLSLQNTVIRAISKKAHDQGTDRNRNVSIGS